MKKTFVFILLGILLLSSLSFVKADIQQVTSGDAPFSLSSWLKHNLGIGVEYSIVGDARSCDDYPERDWNNLQAGSYTVVQIGAYCDDGGLIDTYSNGWNPYKEFGNDIGFTCTSANAPCNIEIYCCPYGWCGNDDDCEDWVGGGSECEHSNERDNHITLDFGTWSWCTEEESVDCWYIENYQCNKRTYNGQTECPPTYQGWTLYDSLSECNGQKCTSGQTKCKSSTVRQICSSGRWTDENCGTGKVCSNGVCIDGTPQKCSDGTNYGSCSTTKPKYCDNGNLVNRCVTCGCTSGTCQSNGSCSVCTPNCPNANTITCGSPIPDGCGGTCTGKGTKCNSGYTCTNNQCIQNQQNAIFQITKTFSKTSGKPGDSIPVSVTVKNIGTVQGSYYVEAGIAPKGWSGYSLVSPNLFEPFAITYSYYKCCAANEFYDGAVVVLAPNEQTSFNLNPKVPNTNSKNGCNNKEIAWSGYTNDYWIGFNACNNCYGEANHNCSIAEWSTTFTVDKPAGYCETDADCTSPKTCANNKCEEPVETCGNTICAGAESCDTCNDCACGTNEVCLSGTCRTDNPPSNESICGDDFCDLATEGCSTCSADCGCGSGYNCQGNSCVPSVEPGSCGDGTCGTGENCGNCLDDCYCSSNQECSNSQCSGTQGNQGGSVDLSFLTKEYKIAGVNLSLWIWIVGGFVVLMILGAVMKGGKKS